MKSKSEFMPKNKEFYAFGGKANIRETFMPSSMPCKPQSIVMNWREKRNSNIANNEPKYA